MKTPHLSYDTLLATLRNNPPVLENPEEEVRKIRERIRECPRKPVRRAWLGRLRFLSGAAALFLICFGIYEINRPAEKKNIGIPPVADLFTTSLPFLQEGYCFRDEQTRTTYSFLRQMRADRKKKWNDYRTYLMNH